MVSNTKNIVDKQRCIFISHASADNKEDKKIDKLFGVLEQCYKVFCSSVPKSGISYGTKLFNAINGKIKNSNIFIAIVTDNYLRSAYCLYEFCIARYLQKRIISIFANEDVELKLNSLQNKDLVSLIANLDKSENDDTAKKIIKSLKLPEKSKDLIIEILQAIANTKCDRPYIGMSQIEYKQILEYCNKEGIDRFGKGQIFNKDLIIQKISKARKIYFLSTTGAGLFKTLKEEALPNALKNGAEVNVILPDKDSEFCEDVALAECKQNFYGKMIEIQNKNRIHFEYDMVFQYLNEAYTLAMQAEEKVSLGTLTCYCSQTLLRQTIVLAIDDNNKAWGWISMTMPPVRTTDSLSFSIDGQCETSSLTKLIIDHCECIKSIAREKGEIKSIDGRTTSRHFNNRHVNCELYWENKKNVALKYMQERQLTYSNVLIEVAAQHPLYNGETPNEEFTRRLDCVIQLYEKLNDSDHKVYIYVPGSRHAHNGINDNVSLSSAGRRYLISKGIDSNIIFADDMNELYKGADGVYNSADECYVSSKIFKENKFGRLLCVCSPYQIMRKTFLYLEQGLIPECYGIPNQNMYHDIVSEYFNSLRITVYEDRDWQDKDSLMFIQTRKNRIPK